MAFNKFIFWSAILFYLSIWILNPSNKLLVFSFFILSGVYYWKFRDIKLSIFFTYLASSVIFSGKTYYIQIIPAGVYPTELYPNGLLLPFIISIKHIFALLMLAVGFLEFKRLHFTLKIFDLNDVILMFFFAWNFLSDYVASDQPHISLLYGGLKWEALIAYFYIKFFFRGNSKVIKMTFWLIVVMMIFETVLSANQFFLSTPLGKVFEFPIETSYFGRAADEILFRFRPVGTFAHTNILASWLSSFSILLFVFFYGRFKKFLMFMFTFMNSILIVTISRGAWLGSMAALLFVSYIMEKLKNKRITSLISKYSVSLIILFIILFLFFVAPRTIASLGSTLVGEGGAAFRIRQIGETLNIIKANPVLGTGSQMSILEGLKYNPLGTYSHGPLTVHNWYFLQVAENGLPSLFFFLLFVRLTVFEIMANIIKSKMEGFNQFMKVGLIGGVISALVVGLFQPFMTMTPLILLTGFYNRYGKNK